jgi:ribosomal protein S18 acetylase RimI-like enzyme
MKLSADEGWNQTERDWKWMIENNGNICILAEDCGKVIGTTAAINYSDKMCWIGMVLVDKEYRGRGISKTLLKNIFEEVKSFRSIKLDATPGGQQVYKKFDFEDEYIITRMTIASMDKLEDDNNLISSKPIKEGDIEEIIALDTQVFGASRRQLVEWLLKQYPDKAFVSKQDNRITGFALGRDGNSYHQVGPVVASTIEEAKALIEKAINRLINQPIVVDVLNDKKDLINWLSSMGFVKQREFIRMYKKENPYPGITGKQYLICGPEFG